MDGMFERCFWSRADEKSWNKPRHLKEGDKVAIVSLSSGILGEKDLKHQLDLGIKLRSFGLELVTDGKTPERDKLSRRAS